jgi:hypothetical protein
VHYQRFAPLLIATALAAIVAAALRVKSGRTRPGEDVSLPRYRGRHVRRGHGQHGRPCRSDLTDRVLSALARVDVWILIVGVAGMITAAAGVVIAYLTLVKPG